MSDVIGGGFNNTAMPGGGLVQKVIDRLKGTGEDNAKQAVHHHHYAAAQQQWQEGQMPAASDPTPGAAKRTRSSGPRKPSYAQRTAEATEATAKNTSPSRPQQGGWSQNPSGIWTK